VGTYGGVWLAIAAVLAILWRRPQVFLLVAAADVTADAVAGLLKTVIGRDRPPVVYPRPAPLVADPHSASLPSGHAATSFACATVLTAFVPKAAPAFYLLAVAIAYSRVYVGVHWPFDVLAGAALGVAIALLLLAATRRRSWPALRRG
jgi:undecaprenyl-diphosphatase